jgi:hypothetical protein
MNRYLAKLGALDEKRASTTSPQNLQYLPKRDYEGPGDFPYATALVALSARCPAYIPEDSWRQAVEDGRRFLAAWGEQAQAFGWTTRDLFGLHTPPGRPPASYRRLARYDETGLIWLLHGRPVLKMTANSAAIRTASGGSVVYRKDNKPALGPLGDSLDDMGSAT